MTDKALLQAQQAQFEALRRQHWAEQRTLGVKPTRRTPTREREPNFTAPIVERERTFDQWSMERDRTLYKPYSWMTTSPYSQEG